MNDPKQSLIIDSRELADGFSILIEGREFPVQFPQEIWTSTPSSLRRALRENLVFGNTHHLPLLSKHQSLTYDIPSPLLSSFLLQNQLYDMTCSEKADEVEPLSYLRPYYNLSFEFQPGEAALPGPEDWPVRRPEQPAAIVPFTFGKESLATVGLCLEMGMRPVLVMSQEPAHPHDEEYKRGKLEEFGREFGVETYFVRNAPGLFRYDLAFGRKPGTELGWGSQTTLLALMCLPFAHVHGAEFILFGNEASNNEVGYRDGWKVYESADQTRFWTTQQSHMVRILTGGRTVVKSTLEPLEELNIFSLLHHRYPAMGRYQFSCSAEEPLFQGSQWCHECYKCVRMFLFARCCRMDPSTMGFKKDLLQSVDLFPHYFGTEYRSGAREELDFAFSILHRSKDASPVLKAFERDKLRGVRPWQELKANYTTLKPEGNLPDPYRQRLLQIFFEEMDHFVSLLPAQDPEKLP